VVNYVQWYNYDSLFFIISRAKISMSSTCYEYLQIKAFRKNTQFIFNMLKHFRRIGITFLMTLMPVIVENGCSSWMTKKGVTAVKW